MTSSYNNRQMYPARYHTCPAANCEKQVNYQMAMCKQHWGRVPTHIQRELYTAWNSGDPTPEHPTVLKVAVEAVNERL